MYRVIVLIAIAATIAAIAGHFLLFGPKRVDKPGKGKAVRRFRIGEVLLHAMTLTSFLVLALTGMIPVLALKSGLHGWFWVLHMIAAPFFVFGLYLLIAVWARDCGFGLHDWEWAKKFGGYLWGDKHAPADKFNAGQKAYFWVVGLLGLLTLLTGLGRISPVFGAEGQDLLYQVHRYVALMFVLAGIVHFYLGTLANPGTLGAMLTGKVTEPWVKSHHPIWWDSISKRTKKQGKG
jgi:formate dehydrogenase subunit gamma